MKRILIVDDDASLRRVTQIQLEEIGYEVKAASDGREAFVILSMWTPALVITDLRMPGLSGIDLLKEIRAGYPEISVIIITAFGSIQNAVEAMRAGAYDYITKPINHTELALTVGRALERQQLLDEVRALRSVLDEKYGFENIIGHSRSLLNLLNLSARAAQTDSTVLIRGETGTGKELLARAIHYNSSRNQKPFITINCGAIPKDLLESEMFGHVRGSFTGAVATKKGKAEIADGGTLFLDEIGELPVELQVKLLRLVQQGEIEKVGATASGIVDVRIIAATNRNLLAMTEDGTFREDLYYRLAVIPLELPPLRDRADDIPELVQHLFAKIREKRGKPDLKLPPSLAARFCGYRWPGNVRELENVIERLVVLSAGSEITLDDFPEYLRREQPAPESIHLDLPPQGMSLEAVEKELLDRALRKFNWNQTQAARYLDISRRTIIYRIEKYGLRKDQN